MNASLNPFPYRLRIEHEGGAGVCLRHKGRPIRFDPAQPVHADDVVIVTTPDPARLRFVQGGLGTVVAPPALLPWVSARDGHSAPVDIDGVHIEMIPYTPASVGVDGMLPRAQGLLRRPMRSARRLLAQQRLPSAQPHITIVTFASGERLLHLNLSLHEGTPGDWLQSIQQRTAGVEWLLLGVVPGQGAAALQALQGFSATHVLFTDFVADIWRELGRPVELLTPTADQAQSMGIDGQVCVSQASFRYE